MIVLRPTVLGRMGTLIPVVTHDGRPALLIGGHNKAADVAGGNNLPAQLKGGDDRIANLFGYHTEDT